MITISHIVSVLPYEAVEQLYPGPLPETGTMSQNLPKKRRHQAIKSLTMPITRANCSEEVSLLSRDDFLNEELLLFVTASSSHFLCDELHLLRDIEMQIFSKLPSLSSRNHMMSRKSRSFAVIVSH
jgi:hypothetical protein